MSDTRRPVPRYRRDEMPGALSRTSEPDGEHVYLVPYIGAGSGEDPYRPLGSDQPGWSAIDLRPDSTVRDSGWALLVVPQRLTPSEERRSVYLGDAPDESLPMVSRRACEDSTGVTRGDLPARLRGDRSIVADLLTVHADGEELCKPLRAMRDGRLRVVLAGKVWWEKAVPAGGATITDDFDRADSTDLGPDWDESHANDYDIFDQKLRNLDRNGASEGGWARHVTDLASVDHYAQAIYHGDSSNDGHVGGTTVRHSTSAETYYVAYCRPLSSSNDLLSKVVNGSRTTLDSAAITGSDAAPLLVVTTIDGSTLEGTYGGVTHGPITDTEIADGTRVGVVGHVAGGSSAGASFDASFDDFEADVLTAPTQGRFALSGVLYAPAYLQGGQRAPVYAKGGLKLP